MLTINSKGGDGMRQFISDIKKNNHAALCWKLSGMIVGIGMAIIGIGYCAVHAVDIGVCFIVGAACLITGSYLTKVK